MHSCPLTLFLVQGGQKDINLAWVKLFIRQLRHTQSINPSTRCGCAVIGQTVLCPYPIPPRTGLVADSHRTGLHTIQTYTTPKSSQGRARCNIRDVILILDAIERFHPRFRTKSILVKLLPVLLTQKLAGF